MYNHICLSTSTFCTITFCTRGLSTMHNRNKPINSDLLNSVNAILRPYGLTNLTNENLLQILLYGHEKLSFGINKKILEATLKCIQASERLQEVRKSPLSCTLFFVHLFFVTVFFVGIIYNCCFPICYL